MSISLPSPEIYAVDVPEVTTFAAHFQYNFFVTDEGSSETGGIPNFALQRSVDEIDTNFLHYADSRVPRYVLINWSVPKIVTTQSPEIEQRKSIFGAKRSDISITDNLVNVVTEDYFAQDKYVGVLFNDGELANKAYEFVSGTLVQLSVDSNSESDVSQFRSSMKLLSLLPSSIKPNFIHAALNQPNKAHGATFFKNDVKTKDTYFDDLHSVSVSAQVNSKVLNDIVDRTISDPYATTSGDLSTLSRVASKASRSMRVKMSSEVAEKDFKTFMPYVDLQISQAAHHVDQDPAHIIGYIIDKTEHLPDGSVKDHPPIVIENPHIITTVDVNVKYGTTYSYTIRAVALFNVPAVDDDTNDVAMITTLVSSKPSTRVYVRCIEDVAPPPPSDMKFIWNYEIDKLLICWSFPPNSQRDIKKFQVFRRPTVDDPFELIKEYDFNDAIVRNVQTIHHFENPDRSLVEVLDSPKLFFIDDDFRRQSSRFIYTVCCIDAHGITSNYGAQFEITFDMFKNVVIRKLISHMGAPKPYPNMYLEADTFVDTIRVGGAHSKRVKVYFDPECYQLVDNNNRAVDIVAMMQRGGRYRLQFINLDDQLSSTLDITIDNRIRAMTKIKLRTPVRPTANRALRVKQT